jgi:hypothetical protein
MADQSGSARFRTRFESALQAYQQTTGVILVEHPVAIQLRNPHSVESITTILKFEARTFSDLLGSDRIMKALEGTISNLFTLTATASFGDAIDLVRKNGLMACFPMPDLFDSHTHQQKQYLLVSQFYLLYVSFYRTYVDIIVTSNCARRPRALILTMMCLLTCSSPSNASLNVSIYTHECILLLQWMTQCSILLWSCFPPSGWLPKRSSRADRVSPFSLVYCFYSAQRSQICKEGG